VRLVKLVTQFQPPRPLLSQPFRLEYGAKSPCVAPTSLTSVTSLTIHSGLRTESCGQEWLLVIRHDPHTLPRTWRSCTRSVGPHLGRNEGGDRRPGPGFTADAVIE
jgi:hypothetical protein